MKKILKINILILLIMFFIIIKPKVISSPIYYDMPIEKFDNVLENAKNGDYNSLNHLYHYYNDLYKNKEYTCIILNTMIDYAETEERYHRQFIDNKCNEIVNFKENSLDNLKQRSLCEYFYIKIIYF